MRKCLTCPNEAKHNTKARCKGGRHALTEAKE